MISVGFGEGSAAGGRPSWHVTVVVVQVVRYGGTSDLLAATRSRLDVPSYSAVNYFNNAD